MREPPLDLARLSRPLARLLRVTEDALDACLVTATEADLPDVERLRREVIGADLGWDDRAYLRWRYHLDCAPAHTMAETAPGTSRLWLFKHQAQILGCLGAERLTLSTPAGGYDAVRFMDLMSSPRVRGMGIGAWLNLKLMPQVEVAISIGGSDQSIGMISRLFHRMPDRSVWALPLRTGPLIVSRWPRTKGVPLLGAASRVVDHALALSRRLAGKLGAPPLEVVETAAPDPAVAALCDSMLRAGFTLVPRTPARWRWRYLENPRRAYTLHAARWDGRTMAVLVARRNGDVAELVDWLWDADQPETVARAVLVTLFTTVIEGFARQGALKVRALTYDSLSEAVCRRLGMRLRHGRSAYAIRAHPESLETTLLAGRWFVTFGDSDGD